MQLKTQEVLKLVLKNLMKFIIIQLYLESIFYLIVNTLHVSNRYTMKLLIIIPLII